MNRTAVAIVASLVAFAIILAMTYAIFTLLVARIPPGRIMGLVGAALMIGSGLACAGVGYLANRWAKSADAGFDA